MGLTSTIHIARACAREATTGNYVDTSCLLFLGGCALTLLAACGLHVERFVAHWDSFESFVRAVMS